MFLKCNPGKGISNLYEMIFHKEKKQDDIIIKKYRIMDARIEIVLMYKSF